MCLEVVKIGSNCCIPEVVQAFLLVNACNGLLFYINLINLPPILQNLAQLLNRAENYHFCAVFFNISYLTSAK
ncbi:hypothetical protein C7N43_31435 [Sphingobacteriales bacterium UPWRP_1]|nr:hypothetical protein C7N43_31435 [Sphingobacteriales bacterium UPWRP_1]